jgi:tetratricopeptide (TPR) repeat protein
MGESRRRRLAGQAAPPAPDIEALLERGLQRQRARDLAGAATLYASVLQARPDHAQAQHLYGLAVLEMGRYELGLGCIRRAIALAPGEAVFHYNLGRALLLSGQAREAAEAYAEAGRLRPDYTQAHLQRAAVLEALHEQAAAASAFRAAIAADPRAPTARAGLARLLYAADDLPGAVAALDAAAALDPGVLADGRIGFVRHRHDVAAVAAARAAALAACHGEGGAAGVEARELAVLDDFLAEPLAYRESALALPYADRSANGVNYPGLQTTPRLASAHMQRIADALGHDLKWSWPDHGSFRLSLAGSTARSDIHVDDAAGRPTYAAVLYLSLPEHCRGGTSFWRHRATGWERAPAPDELRARGYADLDAFHRSLDSPGGGRVDFEALRAGRGEWDLVLEVPMRFNRLIIYRADHYHAISEVFGDTPRDGRLVQLFFFEQLGVGQAQSSSPSS